MPDQAEKTFAAVTFNILLCLSVAEKDVARLKQIKYLLKNEFRTHKGVKKFLQKQQTLLQNVSKKSQNESKRSVKLDL